ncbi:fluoride efflux transporter CrcB [Paenibacillus hamazuiensis]|uniref:fluoride efflux transporter CrcB n=1 Tax=Paenibacillus hamazuiensis TaxID=2936508 RepID=UPI00200D2A7F|nr:fluoride efflux transporter CrcB [Paenibacillus hamazuiensis]
MRILYIGAAGVLGALSRYGLSILFNPDRLTAMPIGTLICNYAGCFFLGWLANAKGLSARPNLKAAITTGFIGSFTTFSAFSVESVKLLQADLPGMAAAYFLFSLWGGLGLAWLGYAAAGKGGGEA